jgi:hypothetical protein
MEMQTDHPASGSSPVSASPQKRWSIDFVRDIFFGLGNLHIPRRSVFSRGGEANSSLMIVALRLADYLLSA